MYIASKYLSGRAGWLSWGWGLCMTMTPWLTYHMYKQHTCTGNLTNILVKIYLLAWMMMDDVKGELET